MSHKTVTISQQTLKQGHWAMARVSEEGEADIPLIAHADGISPAAGHRVTAEQESVLAFMREATKATHTQF